MKKINSILLLFSICLFYTTLSAQDRATIIRNKLINRDQSSVIVVAHRGDWSKAPENSLSAIDNAIKTGVDIVEIDVQKTKDGQYILMHDSELNRTTTGKGLVEEWTLDSLKTLKLRDFFGIETDEKIPTLREALIHAKGKVLINLDKADRFFDDIYQILKETDTSKQIIMKGKQSPSDVKNLFGEYLNDVIYMPVIDLDNENALVYIQQFIQEFNPIAFEFVYGDKSNRLPKI